MALKGKEFNLRFYAQDLVSGHGKTGDVSNFTLRIVKDNGSPQALTNSASEVDALNMKGVYEVLLTASEMEADAIDFKGESSTADVEIYPRNIETHSSTTLGPVYRVADSGNLVAGDEGATTWQNTRVDDINTWDINGNGTGINAELGWLLSPGDEMKEIYTRISFNGGGGRTVDVEFYNYNTTTWDLFDTIPNTLGNEIQKIYTLNSVNYTDGAGNFKMRLYTINTNNDTVSINYTRGMYLDETAQFPSLQEIIDGVNNEISKRHGYDLYNGLDTHETLIESVVNTTNLILINGSSVNDSFNGQFLLIRNPADDVLYGSYVIAWDSITRQVTIDPAFPFTLAPNMYVRITASPPVNVEMINGTRLNGAKTGSNFDLFFNNADADTTKVVENVGDITELVKLDPEATENMETIIKAFKGTDASSIAEVVDSILHDIKQNVLTKSTLFGTLTFDTIVRGLFGAQFGKQLRVVVNPEETDYTKRIEELEIFDYDNGTLMYKMKIENLKQTRIYG